MAWLFQPLLQLIARSTESEMARQLEFLKAENAMLRKRLGRQVRLTAEEKSLLLKLGEAIGAGVKALITIVAFTTYQVWAKAAKQEGVVDKPKRKGGRRKTPDEIRELILRLGRENAWGYSRILGELKKLGIKTSRSNVVNILKANGLDPNSKRGEGSWQEFIAAHGESLWQADFFSKNLITAEGFRQFFCLVFLNVASREAYVSPCTDKPNSAWVEEQTEAFAVHAKSIGKPAGVVFRDRDDKYVQFDETLAKHACRVNRLPYRSPNCNAFVERFIQSLGQEIFDNLLVFGPQHFDYLAASYLDFYHAHRPHQGLGNSLLRATGDAPTTGEVCCESRLGGLLKHYYRKAA